MKSKTVQRLIDKIQSEPFYVRLKRNIVVELYVIRCLGLIKYIKSKIWKI